MLTYNKTASKHIQLTLSPFHYVYARIGLSIFEYLVKLPLKIT